MIIEDLQQGSPDWLAMRVGRVTGSRVCDVLATLKKGGESAARRNYRSEIVVEMLTGLSVEHFVSPAMQWGIDNEIYARTAYELERDVSIEPVGFAVHGTMPRFGASPDGLIGDDGLIEIKCPTTGVHLDYMLSGEIPAEYQAQMLAEMACTDRQWCDFVSFDPRLPKHLQLFIRRFDRDKGLIEALEASVVTFLAEVDEVLERLNSLQENPPRKENANVAME